MYCISVYIYIYIYIYVSGPPALLFHEVLKPSTLKP